MTAASAIGSRTYLGRAERDRLHEQMIALCDEHKPLTLRQLYYLLVSAGTVEKTEGGYRRVMRQLGNLRHAGEIAWGVVVDNSRSYYGNVSHNGLAAFLEDSAALYRRSLWANVPKRVEIWCESDSIAGPITRVTQGWDVRVYPISGFASDGFAYEAAQEMAERGLETFAFYFGDYDPSGMSIGHSIERKLRDGLRVFGGDPDSLHFDRVALTSEQIREHDLVTRPPKASDTRTKNWSGGGTVEIEALPPNVLRELVEDCILRHLDRREVARLRKTERLERETLLRLAGVETA